MFEDEKSHWRFPVLFPEHVTHSQMAMEGAKPVSGGFVNLKDFTVYGESKSLKMKSNPRDAEWIIATLANCSSSLIALNVNHAEDLREAAEEAMKTDNETKPVADVRIPSVDRLRKIKRIDKGE